MHRTPPRGTKMPPPLRVLPALLLLLSATAPLLLCSATVSTNSSSVATRSGVTTVDSIFAFATTILGVYPGVILYGRGIKYEFEVEDPSRLSFDGLHTRHDVQDIVPVRNVTREHGTSIFSFVAGEWSVSRVMDLYIARHISSPGGFLFTTYGVKLDFRRFNETESELAAPNPYYGMKLEVSATVPKEHTVSGYALVGPKADCPRTTADCNGNNGCYDATNLRLPPPGSYKLCVTAKGWNDRLLPWGASTVGTSALVATPLTLTKGIVPSVKLHNGDTSAVVTPENIRIYLVRCTTGTCPSVTPQKGEKLIAVAACDETANRVELSSAPLNAPAGTYALCVVDAHDRASPAALLVTVLQDPFTMEVDSTSSTSSTSSSSVTLRVGGGDLATRTEPYEVCVAENGASCGTVTSESKCTKSAEPNAQTVDVDVSNLASGKITFCLVAKRATYNDRTYLDVPAQIYHVLENGNQQSTSSNDGKNGNQQAGGGEKMLIWLPILIVLLFALAVCGAIFAVRHWRRRKAYTEEESEFDVVDGDRGDGFYRHNVPYGNQSEYTFDEGMSDAMERDSERASLVEQ